MKKKIVMMLLCLGVSITVMAGCSDAAVDRVERTSTEIDEDSSDEDMDVDIEETEDKNDIDGDLDNQSGEEADNEKDSTDLPDGFTRSDSYEFPYIGDFSTTDIYGNAIDSSIFAESEYTLINIWGTFCGPCINEMPELQEIYEDLPENIQMIGIVCDAYTGDDMMIGEAVDIVESLGVEYTNLVYCNDMNDYLYNVQYIPTTLIVDSEGYVITEPIIGADVEAYKEIIAQLGK